MAKLILDIECGSNGGYVVTWYKKNPNMIAKLGGEKQEKEQLKIEIDKLSEQVNAQLTRNSNPHIAKKGIPAEIIISLNDYQRKLLKIFKESGLEMKLSGNAMTGMGKRG